MIAVRHRMIPFRLEPAPAVCVVLLMLAAVPASAAPGTIQYRIDARLDAARGEVSGHEVIAWWNGARGPRQLTICAAPGQRVVDNEGGTTRTVPPGAHVTVELQWTAALSPSGAASVVSDHWYPRAAVGGDVSGGTCLPTAAGRIAPDDPADFEVNLTVPRGWLVASTGREQSALDAGAAGTVHRLRQRGVREFAWVTGPLYVERTRRIDGTPHPVDVRLLLQPEHAAQAERLLDAAVDALALHRRWLSPYPDDHLTMVDTGWRDAMGDRAYPGLITFATRWIVPSTTLAPEAAVARGVSAQWWGGVVGIDPVEDSALADGLQGYFTAMVVEHLFDVRHQRLAYAAFGHAFFGGFIPWTWRGVLVSRSAAYRGRAALGFGTLERYLDAPVMQRALAAVIDRHPDERISRREFFRLAGDAAGQDLRWFEEAVFERAGSFDYAVGSVVTVPDASCDTSPCFRTSVVIERRGDGQFTGTSEPPAGPYESGRAVLVAVSFGDGQRVVDTWDGRGLSKPVIVRSRVPAVSVRVDPDRMLLLDVTQTNNSWTGTPRAARASTRWAVTWAVWLQDLLLSYASLM
jgi:hypothetical protein